MALLLMPRPEKARSSRCPGPPKGSADREQIRSGHGVRRGYCGGRGGAASSSGPASTTRANSLVAGRHGDDGPHGDGQLLVICWALARSGVRLLTMGELAY